VEDEEAIAQALRDDLELESYRVDVCGDGAQALELATQEPYDLMILDVVLPGKSGLEVCRQLRRAKPYLPIIMLTARSHEAEKVLGLDMGADDYVTKPFSPLELRTRIKALLRRSAATKPVRQRFGSFEVDFERMQLRRGTEVIDLTALEFKLLSAFVCNAGRVLSRDRLLDLVWGSKAVITDRVIDTHIANLRRKLGSGGEHIVSVRGFGYRFDDQIISNS
jgi:two-component system alkaline phosphatase synthesis response regulator PhoP